ncbi:HDOD domain-containing protein [Clostridium bowmanii]|uniref:EAL and HDOD domain-containing protein n=1 Tax=Clostridium bowmanii TaxID=132925 RepID=UPI001C0B4BBA|nr:HDOD domain-containing protein [Clostridium bowmanii]MBU3191879.1 HDOD domain-containing protein [Clostridium bowmanii]MCA1076129.1 HDOD domain-containing protein [Clostridium bowmanii]
MEIFIARQPILDKYSKVFGFELLFRDSNSNIYNYHDGDEATLSVIRNSYFDIGMNKIIGNKMAFINFTANLLKSDIFNILHPESVVIEILENIEPDDEIVDACIRLKEKGFKIALDDFVFDEKYKKLIELADIIKIDFKITKGIERRDVISKIKLKNVVFLAEKVETIEEFKEAVSYGYSLFQGYYFSKPVILSSKKIPENKMIYLDLLKELNYEELNFDAIENLIKRDVAISYKLLKIINSARYGLRGNIKFLRQAISLIGEKEIKAWLNFIIMKNISSNKPDILLQNSLIRAKFCELIALNSSLRNISDDAYLMGMLSLIDVILDKPLSEILNEVMVADGVREALLSSQTSRLTNILNTVKAYEEGNWEGVLTYSRDFKLSEGILSKAYLESCQWVNETIPH